MCVYGNTYDNKLKLTVEDFGVLRSRARVYTCRDNGEENIRNILLTRGVFEVENHKKKYKYDTHCTIREHVSFDKTIFEMVRF